VKVNLTCCSLLLAGWALVCLASPANLPPVTSLEVVKHWAQAVGAQRRPVTSAALVASESSEDGIQGRISETIAADGRYRRVVNREFDESAEVVAGEGAERRDWNGFIRQVEGQELERLRSQIFETQTLAFGPYSAPESPASPVREEDGLYVVEFRQPGAFPVKWYVDPKTWLPVKSVRPGEDSTITTTYKSGWANLGNGVLTPGAAKVSETDKPDYEWRRVSIRSERVTPNTFASLKPGTSDVHMDANVPPVPFTMEANHIVVQVSVNGRPPIGFIVDTGADQEVINSTRLADFGIKSYAKTMTTGGGNSAEYEYAAGATFSLPGVQLRNQHVAAIDQTGLEQALGIHIGGLLGYDFISRFVVEVDYANNVLILHDPKRWAYSGHGFVVPVVFDEGIPFTHGTISVPTRPDIPAFFVLDSGAAETMTLTAPFVRRNDLVRLAQTNATVNRPAGLEKQFFAQNNVRGRVERLQLDGITVTNIPINMSVNAKGAYASESFSGTIGEGIFQRYRVFLDYGRKRVIFEPTAETDKLFPERQTYGLSLLASEPDLHTYTVAAVRPNSPAEQDGFHKGDVIRSFDEKSAAQILLSQIRQQLTHAGERHRIVIQRGNDTATMDIQVRLVSLDR
jgi:hypothetical protein